MAESNNTTVYPLFYYKAPALRLYIVLGIVAILVNAIICIIFINDRKLLRKSSLLFGVTCNNLLCGIHLFWSGVYRLSNIAVLGVPRHPWHCVLMVFPDLYPFMFQSLAALLVIGATERWLVFAVPGWFYNNWTKRKGWFATAGAFLFATVTLAGGLCTAWATENMATVDCVQPNMFARSYVSYYLSFSVAAGTLAVIITIHALHLGSRHIAGLPLAGGEVARSKRQLRLTKVMLIICVMDFAFVVVPNTLLLIANLVTLPGTIGNYATAAYGANTLTTLLANLFFNLEFRTAALKLIGRGKNEVTPANQNSTRIPNAGKTMSERTR